MMSERAKRVAAGNAETTFVWSALEFVIPGTVFPLTFDLDVNDSQMGLFLRCLERFARIERIGGYVRNGFGKFALDKVILRQCDTDGYPDTVNKVDLFRDHTHLDSDNATVAQYLNAWSAAAMELDADELQRLLAPAKKEKKAA
jgi:CRISPR type IV-associated protein Csf2